MSKKIKADSPIIAAIGKIFMFIMKPENVGSYQAQHRVIRIKPIVGPRKNSVDFMFENLVVCLVSSFAASEIGWFTPKITTLLGPFR